ncbi:MAG: hypothetical protein KF849_13840 [Rhizobiaceae bacterium]|nr:hypothetical protein [Rhizobiaceae bacterium]
MRIAFRLALLLAVAAAPLAAIAQVRTGGDRFIGETHRYANGSGLVIAIGVQRR